MRVAITGTPGAGKTTIAAVAARHGWRVVDVRRLAQEAGAVVAFDEADQADVVDVAALRRAVARREGAAGKAASGGRGRPGGDRETVAYEGHLSHHLPVDVAWVVRCDPRVLRGRLAARGYAEGKVVENLEAEALDLILQEALEEAPRVVQRDGTRRSPEALFQAFAEATRDSSKGHDLEPVDWSDQLPIQAGRPGARHGA